MDPFHAYQDMALAKRMSKYFSNFHFLRESEYNCESCSSIKWSCWLCERSEMNSFDGYWDRLLSMLKVPQLDRWTDANRHAAYQNSLSKQEWGRSLRIMHLGHKSGQIYTLCLFLNHQRNQKFKRQPIKKTRLTSVSLPRLFLSMINSQRQTDWQAEKLKPISLRYTGDNNGCPVARSTKPGWHRAEKVNFKVCKRVFLI